MTATRRPILAWRAAAASAVAALIVTLFHLVQTSQAYAADYPGLAEIQAAKAAVADAAADVSALDAAIVELEAAAHAADAAARLAADEYAYAQALSDAAQLDLAAANKRAEEALAALEEARADLAHIAMIVYQEGGNIGSLEAILSADGFEDVIIRSEAHDWASVQADDAVQRVKAADIVAQTMQEKAEDSAQKAKAAADAAAEALAVAQDSQRQANAALAEASQTREEAIARLAQMRRTTAAMERERQQGLAAERAREAQLAWEREQQAQQPANPDNGGGGSTPPPNNPDPAPTNPTPTNPAPTTPPPANPTPTNPPPPATGSWKSTAAQGQAAADHALTLMGSDYLLGGEGPAYDCSGLTKVSWGTAGYYLPHSSRSQYAAVTKISYSELRPGDLIFWGTGKDASKIYHVAIYIGNGRIAEASTPGVKAKTRVYNNWAVNDMMPYAGRV